MAFKHTLRATLAAGSAGLVLGAETKRLGRGEIYVLPAIFGYGVGLILG
jgi:hypothetical protein